MNRLKIGFVALAVVVGSGGGYAQKAVPAKAQAPAKFGNQTAITPARLKAHLEFIASDELEGRDTPSRGLDIATMYVATQLKLWGAKPAGENGTFFQPVRLTRTRLDTSNSSIVVAGKTYGFGDGFRGASSGFQADGRAVYVGHGHMVKKKGIDPYAGLDVKGKILVVASGLPKDVTAQDLQGAAGDDYMTPQVAMQKLGAVGVIIVPTAAELARWNPLDPIVIRGVELEMQAGSGGGASIATAGPELVRALFAGERISAEDAMKGADAPAAGFALAENKIVRINMTDKKEVLTSNNVVAIVPGSDPVLKNEYVAFGAHIDHVGMDPNLPGDKIYNGADDDGSGTVGILEIAHAFLTGPRPKRSTLFVWHVGEEKGLWGATYYTAKPTVDLKKVVAQLNIDMIGRSKQAGDTNPANAVLTGPNEIYVVGSTKMSTDLQRVSETVNKSFLKLNFNYKYDDPKDPEQIFYRSDHYLYAQKGIPIIFYFDGVHEDYHQPGDEVQEIDFAKLSKVARTVYATGWQLANNLKRPVVDKPLKG